MKFPRNAKIFKGRLDFAPYASVFFCLLIFILLSTLVYTPGVAIHLPVAPAGQPGVEGPIVRVALTADGRLFYQSESISRAELTLRLKQAVLQSAEPLTLLIEADRDVPVSKLDDLIRLSGTAGITNVFQAMSPGLLDVHNNILPP